MIGRPGTISANTHEFTCPACGKRHRAASREQLRQRLERHIRNCMELRRCNAETSAP